MTELEIHGNGGAGDALEGGRVGRVDETLTTDDAAHDAVRLSVVRSDGESMERPRVLRRGRITAARGDGEQHTCNRESNSHSCHPELDCHPKERSDEGSARSPAEVQLPRYARDDRGLTKHSSRRSPSHVTHASSPRATTGPRA